MTNSSTFVSSDNDSHTASKDSMGVKSFCDMLESSSDEISFGYPGNDPFEEDSILKVIETQQNKHLNVKKRYKNDGSWPAINRARKQKKILSVPILNKRHLIDFWKDFSNGEIFSLPTLGPGKSDSIQRISVDVVKQVLEGLYNIDYQVVDCRFSYEYQGGHIINAANISSTGELNLLFRKPRVLIFHCEFSSIRAPKLAQRLRNLDRMKNPYPSLSIPEVYIMEGGYKKFYNTYPELCNPRGYVTMDNLNYRDLCKKEQYRMRSNKKL